MANSKKASTSTKQTTLEGFVVKPKAKPRTAQTDEEYSSPVEDVDKDDTKREATSKEKSKAPPDESDLPPINKIPDMFNDMVTRIPKLVKVAERVKGRKLRIATMCSGTESPLLALDLINRSIQANFGISLPFEHVFSCEIEPFKQAYIERNFQPPILFRDVCELGGKKATTAYGSKAVVPGNVDVLIAGTSCVDYSNLNNEKQDIDANGESGRTFRGMMSWVKTHQPPIVILENVCGAPWPRVQGFFKDAGYTAEFMRLDTKLFYIPHTRTRVYLVAYRLRKTSLAEEWKTMMGKITRPASCTLDAFLLESDDPRIHQARQKLVQEASRGTDKKTGRTDWGRCESRHQRARLEEELGLKRPLTGWEEGGVCKLSDYAWNDWGVGQVERVWDLMDISLLRSASKGVDPSFKTQVWNLSQNVDRTIGSGRVGICPCLTPSMIPYVTNRGGPMVGLEALSMQGLPVDELLLTRETEDQLADLAGNAMSTTVVGSVLIAALIVGKELLEKGEVEDAMDVDNGAADAKVSIEGRIKGDDLLTDHRLDLSAKSSEDVESLLQNAQKSARLCECEGRDGITARVLQRCLDCAITVCEKCGGRPQHNFEVIDLVAEPRTPPALFRKQLKAALGMCLSVSGINESTVDILKDAAEDGLDDKAWAIWRTAVLRIPQAELRFKEEKRQAVWMAGYDSPTAWLEFHAHPLRPEWRLYAKPEPSEPANSRVRKLLADPVARMLLTKGRSLLEGTWEFAVPASQTFKIEMKGIGELVPSWEARLGLQAEALKEKKIWSKWEITVPSESLQHLDRDISGSYTLLEKCGTANASLHRKDVVVEGQPPLFMFLDPTRCGDPATDSFVFSPSIRRTEFGETRDIVARLDPKWRQGDWDGSKSVALTVWYKWVSWDKVQVKASHAHDGRYSVPSAQLSIEVAKGSCSTAKALLTCRIPLRDQTGESWPKEWTEVDPIQERATFKSIAWLVERIRNIENLGSWNDLALPDDHSDCDRCAPSPPALQWVQGKKGIVALEDASQAGKFEQALKKRPAAFVTHLRVDENGTGQVRIGCNVSSLIHRALSRLPKGTSEKPRLSWRLSTDYTPPVRIHLPKFTLASNKQDPPAPQPPNFIIDLRPEQLRSLHWMLAQESEKAAPFIEEEISEAILHPLAWRAEGKAEVPIRVSGGVLADEVGYGKTAITLGLIDSTAKAKSKSKSSTIDLTDDADEGRIRTNATLVIVPPHLTGQWESEIEKFTGDRYKLVVMHTMANMNSRKIQDFLDADVIVVPSNLTKGDIYLSNLQAFAGSGPLPNKDGRYFDARLQESHDALPSQIALLREEGAEALFEAIETKGKENEKAASDAFVQSKRLKGKHYRDAAGVIHEGSSSEAEPDPVPGGAAANRPAKTIVEVVITKAPGNIVSKKRVSAAKKIVESSDEDEDLPPRRKRTTRKSKKSAHAADSDDSFVVGDSDVEMEEESASAAAESDSDSSIKSEPKPKSKPKAKPKPAKKAAAKPAKKRKSDVLEDGSDDDEGKPRKKAKVTKPKPKPWESDPWKLKTKPVRRDWRQMQCPPLELFHFGRVVIDEYTYLDGKGLSLINKLRSDHRWVLSGTPPLEDFASVKTIAAFLGIHLGVDDDFYEGQSKESLREAKRRQKDQTAAEKFHSFREVHSLDWHGHRHSVAQRFLDQFVRQNIAEIDEIKFEEHIKPIVLPAAERAIYLELEHHLRSLDMTIKRGRKGENDREKRLAQSLGDSNSAEEALLKRCSHFELETDKENALKACEVIVQERTRQREECKAEFRLKIAKAAEMHQEIGRQDEESPFERWLRICRTEGVGDKEATEALITLLDEAGCDGTRPLATSTNRQVNARPKPKPKPKAKKSKDDSDEEMEEANESDDDAAARKKPSSREDLIWEHRELTHELRKLEKELVARVRSLRYFTAVRDLQRKDESAASVVCPNCKKTGLELSNIAILSSCGHMGCRECVDSCAIREECVYRSAVGSDRCNAAARLLNVVSAESLGVDDERKDMGKHYGMKLEKVIDLIKNHVPKRERVLLFVQFPDLTKKVAEALDAHKIPFIEIRGTAAQKSKNLTQFQKDGAKEKVLLLNVGDESASGANLTVANHVIFLSPLLTSSQQFYDATEIQAIGRLRRYGQQKVVHIWRFLTKNSIDVDIYEERTGKKNLPILH